MAHVVYFNQGDQTLRTVPTRGSRAVKVAAGTYTIKDLRYSADSAAHVLDAGSVTLDTVNTTLSVAGGRGTTDPYQLTLDDATGVTEGVSYLLRNGGRDELVTVAGVSGTTVRLRSQVLSYFPSGSLFLGVTVSCTVPAAVTSNDDYLGHGRLAVEWVLGDLAPVGESIYLERSDLLAGVVTRADLLAVEPHLADYDHGDKRVIDRAIAKATDDLRTDLLGAGFDDSSYMTGFLGKQALIHGAALHVVKHLSADSAARLADYYRGRYDEIRTNLIQGLQKAKTAKLNEDGSAKSGPDYHSIFPVQW